MLGIIFTRKRMFAAWSDNGVIKWIPVGLAGKKYVFHSRSYLQTLQNHFNHIYQSAQWHAFGNGMTPLESPSLALVFPGDELHITASEKQVVLNWITSRSVGWSSVRMIEMTSALTMALPRQFSDFILFEAIDDGLQINSNIFKISEKIAALDLGGLGREDGVQHIYNKILQELEHKKLTISDDSRLDLMAEIDEYKAGKKLIINYIDSFSRISIDLSLSPSRYFDLLTWKRDKYYEILKLLRIAEYPGTSMLFVSDLFDNPVFRDYIKNIAKQQFIDHHEIQFVGETQALEKIMESLHINHTTPRPSGKSGLIAEIKAKCTDKRKYRQYLEKYLPMARKLDMPDEIIIWYIRQSINSLQKLSSLGEIVDRPYQEMDPPRASGLQATEFSFPKQSVAALPLATATNENQVAGNETLPNEKPLIKEETNVKVDKTPQFDPDLMILDQNLLRRIGDFAAFEEKIPSREFIGFKGKLLGEKKKLVFRILKNNASELAVSQFEKLQEREKSYYKDCSEIEHTTFGDLYYHRPFFEGERLETYVKRTGLNKKFRLKDISAFDLELMLELWRIIYRLKFSFANLSKDSFIVGIHWRLPLKKEIDVKLINIDTSDSNKEDMEIKMTEIFEEIFGENLTNEFKKQFQNH